MLVTASPADVFFTILHALLPIVATGEMNSGLTFAGWRYRLMLSGALPVVLCYPCDAVPIIVLLTFLSLKYFAAQAG